MTTQEVKELRITDKIKTISISTSSFCNMPIMKVLSYNNLNTGEVSFVVITRKGIEDFDSYVYAITRGKENLDFYKFTDASKCSKFIKSNKTNI